MGIIDTLLSPIEDVINDLKAPVEKVVQVFGEVVDITEDIIKSLWNMIKEIKSLFTTSGLEAVFISPFKKAVLLTITEIKNLYNLISNAEAPTAEGLSNELKVPIKICYDEMKSAVNLMNEAICDLINNIENEGITIVRALHNEISNITGLSARIISDTNALKDKVEKSFTIIKGKAFTLPPSFTTQIDKQEGTLTYSIRTTGNTIVKSFDNITESIKKRLDNENEAMDMFILLIVLMLIITIIGIFIYTQSILIIGIIIVIFLIAGVFSFFT